MDFGRSLRWAREGLAGWDLRAGRGGIGGMTVFEDVGEKGRRWEEEEEAWRGVLRPEMYSRARWAGVGNSEMLRAKGSSSCSSKSVSRVYVLLNGLAGSSISESDLKSESSAAS